MLPPARNCLFSIYTTEWGVPTNVIKRRGRPKRSAIEAVRTIWWYWTVRTWSKLSETKLENEFDQLDRVASDKHRSTRWNKYKFGKSSPSPGLLDAVDAVYRGTRAAYEHDLWRLAESSVFEPDELRQIAARLPEVFKRLVLADDVPDACAFWLRQGVDLSQAAAQVSDPQSKQASVVVTVCFLLLIARLAVLLQDEDMHLHAYRGIARLTTWSGDETFHKVLALLVAVLLQEWSATEYRNPTSKALMEEMMAIDSGTRPPWLPEQRKLKLGVESSDDGLLGEALSKYFWMATKLAT